MSVLAAVFIHSTSDTCGEQSRTTYDRIEEYNQLLRFTHYGFKIRNSKFAIYNETNMYSSLFLMRLAVGAIFIHHALPKLRDPKAKASGMGWSSNQVLGLGIIEFISGVALIGGVGVKMASLALSVVMLGAIYHKMKKWHVPFSSHNSTGWEFDMLLLAANLTFYLK